jgi:xylan 1,4-beta-xylosidase
MMIEQTARVEPAADGRLVLTPVAHPKGDRVAAAVVARATVSGSYTAVAKVDAQGTAAGALAGLAAYSWRDAAVGVALGAGRVTVWRREGKEYSVVAGADAPPSAAVFLRMTAEGGERYHFAFSGDGRKWAELGGPVNGSHVEGARVALTASEGAARFDWVRIKSSSQLSVISGAPR